MSIIPPQNVREAVDAFIAQPDRSDAALETYVQMLDPESASAIRRECRDRLALDRFFDDLGQVPDSAGGASRPTRVGQYALERLLGRGGMGEVFFARAAALDRPVAVKLLPARSAGDQERVERFRREARTLATLDHPGIVRVFDAGESDGRLWFAMEFVDGVDLAHALRAARTPPSDGPRTPLPPSTESTAFETYARVVADIADAIAYLHGRGAVHRDLKPSNVLVGSDGRPKVADFGLARPHDAGLGAPLTRSAEALGTESYWSPEKTRGETCPAQQDDVWALGVVLFETVVGRRPFAAAPSERAALVGHRGSATPTVPDDVPSELARVCRRALTGDPLERYGSAGELAADLRRFVAREPVEAGRADRLGRTIRLVRRHRRAALAACASLAILAGAVIGAAIWSERAAVRGAADALLEASAQIDVRRSPLPTLAVARSECGRLAASEDLDAERRQRLAERAAAVEARAADLRTDGFRLVALGAGTPPGTSADRIELRNDAFVLAGIARILRADAIAPPVNASDPVVAAYSNVRVAVDGPGGERARIAFMPMDAARDVVGEATLEREGPGELLAPPGFYRVVAAAETGFAEVTRLFDYAGVVDLRLKIVPTALVVGDMVDIPAGEAWVGQTDVAPDLYQRRRATVPAFRIDRHETTCAEYRAFVEATGHPAPRLWGGRYNPAWDRLPVLGVSWRDAERYAEWAGKRLPTWTEWQVATRGRAGSQFPWGDKPPKDNEGIAIGAVGKPWNEGLRPVGSSYRDVTAEFQLHDALGNAPEWTATPNIVVVEGQAFPCFGWRLAAGFAFNESKPSDWGLEMFAPNPPQLGCGFRCAKSVGP